MNNQRGMRSFLLLALLMFASACSTIKGWFPDKERDYQFTAEIPEMMVPDDLKGGGMVMPAPSQVVAAESQTTPVAAAKAPLKQSRVEKSVADKAAIEPEQSVSMPKKAARAEVEPDDSAANEPATPGSSLQIDQPRTQAAHIVAKALSRQKLEITERNIDKGYFYLKFDPNAVKAEDKTWLDELNFVFGDEPSQEREYRVRLRQINPQLTEVTVLDVEGGSQSSALANALLKLITDAINQDLTEQAAPKTAEANGEAKPETK